jgi:hypothetical protein
MDGGVKVDSKKVLTETLKRCMVNIEGMEIPLLNKFTERIEINCHGGCVGDIKPTMRFKGGDEGG